jgi:hypothetical protein
MVDTRECQGRETELPDVTESRRPRAGLAETGHMRQLNPRRHRAAFCHHTKLL